MISARVAALLDRIERCRAKMGWSEAFLGRFAAHDAQLVDRLRNGGTITLRTLDKIEFVLGFAELSKAETAAFLEANEAAIARWQKARSAT